MMSQLRASAYSYHVLAASLHPCTSFHALLDFTSFVSLGTDACFLLWAALVAALPSSRFHVCTWRERCQNKAVLLNMPELWCPDISWSTLGSQKATPCLLRLVTSVGPVCSGPGQPLRVFVMLLWIFCSVDSVCVNTEFIFVIPL